MGLLSVEDIVAEEINPQNMSFIPFCDSKLRKRNPSSFSFKVDVRFVLRVEAKHAVFIWADAIQQGCTDHRPTRIWTVENGLEIRF